MQPKRDEDFFWDGVDNGKLLVQRCCQCGTVRHPPLPSCPECLSMEWRPVEIAGEGTVYSWLVSKHPNDPQGPGRVVVLVDMDEGVRITANLCAGGEVAIGDRVKVAFKQVDGVTLPEFQLANLPA